MNSPPQRGWWNKRRLTLVIVVAVVAIGGATGLTLWFDGQLPRHRLGHHEPDGVGDHWDDPADRGGVGDDRAGQPGQPQLRGARDRDRSQRQGRPDRHGRAGARHIGDDGAAGRCGRGVGTARRRE